MDFNAAERDRIDLRLVDAIQLVGVSFLGADSLKL